MNSGIKIVLKTLYDFCVHADFNHPHMIIAKELLFPEKAAIGLKTIKLVVYNYFGFKEEYADSNTRKREIVQARQIAMELAYRLGTETGIKWSLHAIGAEIGHKDHATVLHAIKTVNNLRETNREFNNLYSAVEFAVRSKITYNGNTE